MRRWIASTDPQLRRSTSSCTESRMLIAIESSCIAGLFESGERGLAETDPAVVGRDCGVHPDAKFRSGRDVVDQQPILEDPAREDEYVDTVCFCQDRGRATEAFGKAAVERARNFACIAAAETVVEYGGEKRAEVKLFAGQRKRVGRGAGAASKVLHPHGCLAFEGDLTGEAEQRGDGLEQTADRGSREGADAFDDQLDGVRVPRREVERRGPAIGNGVELREEAGGRLNGVTGGGIASGERRRTEVHRALKPFGDAADQELTAPDSAIVAIARPVEAHADYSLRPRPALGEHGGNVGAVVLDAAGDTAGGRE